MKWGRIKVKVGWASLLMALAVSCASQEAALQFEGRLFTTPDERRMLDRLREGVGQKPVSREPVLVAPKPPPSAEPLQFDGMVVRSLGPDTVWVDGRPLDVSAAAGSDVRVERGADAAGTVTLRVPEQVGTLRLRPGQRYDPDTGSVTEAFDAMAGPREPGAKGR